MSEFSVHRTPDRIPGLMYCLVLDGKRIAGGKPDCSGDNIVASWSTKETYGQVEGLMADVERYKAARDASVGLATKTIERIRELEAENDKLRELCYGLAQVVKNDDDTFRRLREIAKQELSYDFIGMYDSSLGNIDQIACFIDSMRELGIETE